MPHARDRFGWDRNVPAAESGYTVTVWHGECDATDIMLDAAAGDADEPLTGAQFGAALDEATEPRNRGCRTSTPPV